MKTFIRNFVVLAIVVGFCSIFTGCATVPVVGGVVTVKGLMDQMGKSEDKALTGVFKPVFMQALYGGNSEAMTVVEACRLEDVMRGRQTVTVGYFRQFMTNNSKKASEGLEKFLQFLKKEEFHTSGTASNDAYKEFEKQGLHLKFAELANGNDVWAKKDSASFSGKMKKVWETSVDKTKAAATSAKEKVVSFTNTPSERDVALNDLLEWIKKDHCDAEMGVEAMALFQDNPLFAKLVKKGFPVAEADFVKFSQENPEDFIEGVKALSLYLTPKCDKRFFIDGRNFKERHFYIAAEKVGIIASIRSGKFGTATDTVAKK